MTVVVPVLNPCDTMRLQASTHFLAESSFTQQRFNTATDALCGEPCYSANV